MPKVPSRILARSPLDFDADHFRNHFIPAVLTIRVFDDFQREMNRRSYREIPLRHAVL